MERGSLPPEVVEKLRNTGIRLDGRGRFWHEGEEITHPRFRTSLLRWLDLLNDGRPILRLDDTRYAYLEVDDALLLVKSLRWEGDRVYLSINDGSEEELDYESLRQREDGRLYCLVRNSRLLARIETAAYYILAEKIEEVDESFALVARGERFFIRSYEDTSKAG